MNDMDWCGEYKDKILRALLTSDDVVKLINPKEEMYFDIEDVLLGGTFFIDGEKKELQGHLFDFYYVPDTTTESKVFICTEVEVESITKQKMTQFALDVWVFTKKNDVKLSNYSVPTRKEMQQLGYFGNRIDMLCSAIDKKLRGANDYGLGEVTRSERGYRSKSAPNTDYYGMRLRYNVKNYTEVGDSCEN